MVPAVNAFLRHPLPKFGVCLPPAKVKVCSSRAATCRMVDRTSTVQRPRASALGVPLQAGRCAGVLLRSHACNDACRCQQKGSGRAPQAEAARFAAAERAVAALRAEQWRRGRGLQEARARERALVAEVAGRRAQTRGLAARLARAAQQVRHALLLQRVLAPLAA